MDIVEDLSKYVRLWCKESARMGESSILLLLEALFWKFRDEVRGSGPLKLMILPSQRARTRFVLNIAGMLLELILRRFIELLDLQLIRRSVQSCSSAALAAIDHFNAVLVVCGSRMLH